MRTSRPTVFALLLTATGCSLIAAPDENLLLGGGGEVPGGSGGDGGTGALGGGGMGGLGGGGMGGLGGGGMGGLGGGGMGGAGGGCAEASECPQPAGNCEIATCADGVCGFAPAADGTPVPAAGQTDFDCKQVVCDGAGAEEEVNDDADLPFDNNECTDDICTAGAVSNPFSTAGDPCGAGLSCNGAGVCSGCTMPSQCGVDNDCQTPTCVAGACGFNFEPLGTAVTTQAGGQTDFDCQTAVCDGNGGVTSEPEDTDLPEDGAECTDDVCTNGVASNPDRALGTGCTENGGSVCNATGDCVDCNVPGDCGAAPACEIATCVAETCGTSDAAAGTLVGTQTPGDCRRSECDGMGNVVPNAIDNADLPTDALDCTSDICMAGVPSNPPQALGFTCNDAGGTVCNAVGGCVQCNAPADCTTIPDTFCQTPTCTSGACGASFEALGTALPAGDQLAGNCQLAVCNGNGGTTSQADNTDVPVDLNQCTQNVCSAGVPSNPFENSGTPCTQDGGFFCNGSGACVECTTGAQCGSGVCTGNVCQAGSCSDNLTNGTETDTDCGGGVCPACPNNDACLVPADCLSGICTSNTCQAVTVSSVTVRDQSNLVVAAAGATGVPTTPPSIVVTFSGAVQAASLTLDTTLDAGACTGAIQVSSDEFATCIPFNSGTASLAGNVATLTPSPHFSFGTSYKVRVTSSVLDAGGGAVTAFTLPTAFTTRTDGTAGVVISQVYGGGGNAGATYLNDFIELHNRSSVAVDISGWSVQYASSTGTAWQVTNIPAATILQPGEYFLVQEGSGGAIGVMLPTADAVGSIGMSGTTGKVALVSNTTALSVACPTTNVVDFVGYGPAVNCVEGVGTTANLTNSTSAFRRIQGCYDTNGTAVDIQNLTPNARNTASPDFVCAGPVRNESGATGEVQFCNLQFPQTLNVAAGASTGNIFGRIFVAGVTEPAGAPAGVIAQLGFGAASTNPQMQTGWTWQAATFNTQVGNDDEFQSSFLAPASGTYAYTYRFSLDGGATWTVCDADGAGSNVGLDFETPELGILTVP